MEIIIPSRGYEVDKKQVVVVTHGSHGSIDKLDVYRGLGVREVWVFEAGAFRIVGLRGDRHVPLERSEVLPEVELARSAHYARRKDQHAGCLPGVGV